MPPLQTDQTVKLNPFVYGHPVRGDEFVDREDELRNIFNRLCNGESPAIIGEPKIGKTSLLLKLLDKETQRSYLGDYAERLVFSLLDSYIIGENYAPGTLWQHALSPLQHAEDTAVSQQLENAEQNKYEPGPLKQLFDCLGGQGKRLVLLLDEFERLLTHSNFQEPTFFASLRSMATLTGGLALVFASRLSVTEMNKAGQSILKAGSPLFGYVIPVPLRPFKRKTVDKVLNRGGEALSDEERRFIQRMAGCHPYLVQAMAAALYEAPSKDRQSCAAVTFYDQVSYYFEDMWQALSEQARTAAIILSLVEMYSRTLGKEFDCSEFKGGDAFGIGLGELNDLRLAEKVDEDWQLNRQHLCCWQGEQWTMGAQAFAWWLYNMVILEDQGGVSALDFAPGGENSGRLLTQLSDKLIAYFNEEELRTLCMEINQDYDNLPAQGKSGKARELVLLVNRRGQVARLIEAIKRQYSNAWEPDVFEMAVSMSHKVRAYDEWLRNRCYCLVLADEQWACLVGTLRSVPQWIMGGIGMFAQVLFEELAKRRQQ